ncbi:deoxycytidylate deaminase [Methylocystis heyeri]|uniref:Cell division protein DedD n=1 Tax=Methylocystis heyeri TaxID=391905 RepID=A0A6B8KCZ4_9HYPH|nr:cell division protein DedD [Methylocystis heyeri]
MFALSDRWIEYFFDVAQRTARMSKDPSTQVGAVIVRPDKTIASTGFNGFPRGVPDYYDHYERREHKYPRIIHAEANAILSSHEPVRGYKMFVTHCPCARCAGTIIQAGIEQVAYPEPSPEVEERWGDEFTIARSMFGHAGVYMHRLPAAVMPMSTPSEKSVRVWDDFACSLASLI